MCITPVSSRAKPNCSSRGEKGNHVANLVAKLTAHGVPDGLRYWRLSEPQIDYALLFDVSYELMRKRNWILAISS